jgi:hypothetical protein
MDNPAVPGISGMDNPAVPGISGMDNAADAVPTKATKSTGRRRKPTAIAMAASEQALEGEKAKGRQRKRSADTVGVSRTQHGGVKIGGRAVTWVGGAGMAREVCCSALSKIYQIGMIILRSKLNSPASIWGTRYTR